MDINEFHLMFKKESPLFNSNLLGEIVGKVLQHEKVPNSGTPTPVEHPVTKTSQRKEKNSMKRLGIIRSAESVLPSYSLVNESTPRGCIRKPDSVIESSINSLSMVTLESNTLPTQSCSHPSQKAYTHTQPMCQAGGPEVPIKHLTTMYDLHTRVVTNAAASSKTNWFDDSTVCPSTSRPYTQTYPKTKTYDTSTNIANECVWKNTSIVGEKVTEGIIEQAKMSPSKGTLSWQSITGSPCQQSFSLQNESSNAELKRASFDSDKTEETMSSGRQIELDTVRQPFDAHLKQLQEAVYEPVQKQTRIDENIKTCGDKQEKHEVKDGKVLTPIAIGKVAEKEMLYIINILVQAQTCFAQFPPMVNKPDDCVQNDETTLTLKKAKYMYNTADIKDQAKDEKHLRKKLVDITVKYFEQKIVETVRFAKKIPGFRELPQDDQASLIKASRNESDLISGLKSVNVSDKVFTSLDGESFSVDQMKMLFPEEMLNLFIEGSRKVEKLKATVEEKAVLRAITITFSDRCELQCKEKVEDIQNRLVSCLLFILKRQPVPLAKRMGQMFDFLLFCRRYSDVELKKMKTLVLETDQYSPSRIVSEVL